MKCIKCSTSPVQNWTIYLCVTFISLTIFFIFILLFRINVSTPKFMTYVLLCQGIASPTSVQLSTDILSSILWINNIVLALYGIWNLDFLRTLMPPVCLNNISTLQVLTLDYAVAVYPLGLVVLTYMLIQLHARGCMPLVVLWLPFRRCHVRSIYELSSFTVHIAYTLPQCCMLIKTIIVMEILIIS